MCLLMAGVTCLGASENVGVGEGGKPALGEAVKLYVKGDFSRALEILDALGPSGEKENDRKMDGLREAILKEMTAAAPAIPDGSRAEIPLRGKDIAEALCEVGFTCAAEGDWERAEQLFLEAERKAEDFLPACVALADLYGQREAWQRSLAKWEEAQAMAQDNDSVRLGLALAVAKVGEVERSERMLQALSVASDVAGIAGVELGRLLWREGRAEEAKERWEACIAQAPMEGFTFFAIAECCEASGDLRGAEIGYRKALELSYEPELCRKRLSSLGSPGLR